MRRIPDHQVPRNYSLVIYPNSSWTAWRAKIVVWGSPSDPLLPPNGLSVIELGEEFRDPASAGAALVKLLPSEPKEGGAE